MTWCPRIRRLAVLTCCAALSALGLGATPASAINMQSDPAVVSMGVGTLNVFGRGGDSHLWMRAYHDGSWFPWEDLGAPPSGVDGKPSVVSWGQGHLDVFVKSVDNHLYHRFWWGGQWYPWAQIGSGAINTSPRAVAWEPGRVDVFARGNPYGGLQAGPMLHAFTSGVGAAWSGLEDLGGDLTSGPIPVSWGSGHLDIFARGTDGLLYHRYFLGGWSEWRRESTWTFELKAGSAPSVVSWGNQHIDVFARGNDDGMWHVPFVAGTIGWGNIEYLGGTLTSNVAPVSWGYGHEDAFSKGTDDRLYHRFIDFNSNLFTWQWWQDLPGQYTAGDPAVIAPQSGEIDVVSRDGANNYTTRQFTAITGWTTGWATIGRPPDPDTTPPTAAVSSNIGNADMAFARHYNVHATASDASGIQKITATVVSSSGAVTPIGTVSGGVGDFDLNAAALPIGSYTIRAVARDNAGNDSAAATIAFDRVTDDSDDDLSTIEEGAENAMGEPTDPVKDARLSSALDEPGVNETGELELKSADPQLDKKKIAAPSRETRWVGMSDQIATTWSHTDYQDLAINHVRLITAYNVVSAATTDPVGGCANQGSAQCAELAKTDAWMAAQRNSANTSTGMRQVSGRDVDIIVSFWYDRLDRGSAPSDAEYLAGIRAFMRRYPYVGVYTAWNEPNLVSSPYRLRSGPLGQVGPYRAGQLYGLLKQECDSAALHPKCLPLAGDFSDGFSPQHMKDYMEYYEYGIKNVLGSLQIGGWAIHLHGSSQARDASLTGDNISHDRPLGNTKWLPAFLHRTENSNWAEGGPPVWITEVGAMRWKEPKENKPAFDHRNRNDLVDQSLLNIQTLMSVTSRRVKRVYYYQWRGDASWDSGLFTPHTNPDTNGSATSIWHSFWLWTNMVAQFTPKRGTASNFTQSGTSASFDFQTDSVPDHYECRIDGGAWETCTSPAVYPNLSEGDHVFEVRGVAAMPAGSTVTAIATEPVTTTVTIDRTAPQTTISGAPPTATSATTASLEFSSSGETGLITYQCKLDSGTWVTCASPKALTGLAAGSHTFSVRAIDAAGNVDATPATATWTVDATAPDTTISSGTPGSGPAASIAFAGTDNVAVSGYECQLDAGAWAACTSPKALSGLAAGSHTFKVRALDGAGNADATPATVTWTVDGTAPNTTISTPPSAQTIATTASIPFSGTDDVGVTGYECQLDGGTWASCTSPKALSGLAVGSHTFGVRAKDAAGNVDATPATATWTVLRVLLGEQTVQTNVDTNPAGAIEGWPYVAASSGTAGAITVYLDATSTAPDLKVGLYGNGSSKPGSLLASGSVASPLAGGWVKVPLTTTPTVTSGTTYWLALMSTGAGIKFRDRPVGGACTGHASGSGMTAPPATWGTDFYTGTDCPGSLYLTATP